MGRINLFSLLRFIRKIKVMLGCSIQRSPFYLFNVMMDPCVVCKFYELLIPLGYQYNYLSYQERGQVMNVRKLTGVKQFHLRLYDDGAVHGHYELNYEFFPNGHLAGEMLTVIPDPEFQKIKKALAQWLNSK